jgi:hypothetical protein
MGDKLITAAEATPEEQYKWLMLGEKYWINGTDAAGTPVTEQYGNQISYTLKFFPDVVGFEEYKTMLLQYQSQIRCCSTMPQIELASYEYQPEQMISREEYLSIVANINTSNTVAEDINLVHIDCAAGGCPVDFNDDTPKTEAAAA